MSSNLTKRFSALLWGVGAFLLSYAIMIWTGFKGMVPMQCARFGRMSVRVFAQIKTPMFSAAVWIALIIAMFVFAIKFPKENKYNKLVWSVFFVTLGIYVCYMIIKWPSCLI